MTYIIFIVDTSFSMAVKNYRGYSTLDTAKSFISEFVKVRLKDVNNKNDKFLIITSEKYPRCIREIKQSNREGSHIDVLKTLRCKGQNVFLDSLYNAFHFVNSQRNALDMERYGYGRYPFIADPVFFITISDCKSIDEIPLNVKLESKKDGDLTREAYRWDQRLFSVVLRMGSECLPWVPGSRVGPDVKNIERVCNMLGGNSFCINGHKEISPCIEMILQSMILPGVNVKFVCPSIQGLRLNGETETPETKLKKRLDLRPFTKIIIRFICGKPVSLHWPIPEAFSSKRIKKVFPPRSAHPAIFFGEEAVSAQFPEIPYDKYELEPSPLVDYMLERFKSTKDDKKCLHVFIHGSDYVEGFGKPFGFLKLTTVGTGVNLFIMPYNYPVLFPLLDELKLDPNIKINIDWRRRLEGYLDSVPPYYIPDLKKHLQKFRLTGIRKLEELSPVYDVIINKNLQTLRTLAEEELKRTFNVMKSTVYFNTQQYALIEKRESVLSAKYWKNFVDSLNNTTISQRERKSKKEEIKRNLRNANSSNEEHLFKDPAEFDFGETPQRTKFPINFAETRIKAHNGSSYRNPLLVKKTELTEQIPKMMANLNLYVRDSNIPLLEGGKAGFSLKLHHAEELHQLPVQQMGNYEEYVKAQTEQGMDPLREIEAKPIRVNTFGNPFKIDKKSIAIDEVGECSTEQNSSILREKKAKRGRPPKRKPGPLSANSLSVWRERRRTLSGTSSILSDLSYLSELDIEDVMQTEHFISEHLDRVFDAFPPLEIDIEDKDEVNEEPKIKKQKTDVKHLSYEQLEAIKEEVNTLVNEVENDQASVLQLHEIVKDLLPQDQLEILNYGLETSQRWERMNLCNLIKQEIYNTKKMKQPKTTEELLEELFGNF